MLLGRIVSTLVCNIRNRLHAFFTRRKYVTCEALLVIVLAAVAFTPSAHGQGAFVSDYYEGVEGGAIAITFTRPGGVSQATTSLYINDQYGNTVEGSQTITWGPGDGTVKTLNFSVRNDQVVTANIFGVGLNGRLKAYDSVFAPIERGWTNLGWLDNDTSVGFANAAFSVDDTAGMATVAVSRIGKVGSVSVSYATGGGTAIANQDYTPVSGSLTWADGDMVAKNISIPIKVNATATGNRTVSLTLKNLINNGGGLDVALLGTSTSALTIVKTNPGVLAFSQGIYRVDETGGEALITVARTAGSDGAVAVNYSTSNGSALAGSDYTATSGTLNWSAADTAPKTFKVAILPDQLTEPDETINLSLTAPTGSASLGSLSNAQLIINANNTPPTIKEPNIQRRTSNTVGVSIDIKSFVTYTDPKLLLLSVPNPPSVGTVSVSAGTMLLTYTPAPAYAGPPIQFEYVVTDPYQASAKGTVTVIVGTLNNTPVAKDVTQPGIAGQPLRIDLNPLISDQDKDALAVSISKPPANGNAILEQKILTYTSKPGFAGADTFQYTVSDSFGGVATATITANISATVTAQAQGIQIEKLPGADNQIGKLNNVITLAVRVIDGGGQPLPDADVAWNLLNPGQGASVRQGVSAQATLVTQENKTDSSGIARATLQTGTLPSAYEVTASASVAAPQASASTKFVIATGLRALTRPNTPEGGLAETLDTLCPKLLTIGDLSAPEQALLKRCNEIFSASGSGDGQIVNALRALAPEEVATQGRMGNNIAMQQLGNIGARLAALRSGANSTALSGLSFNIKGNAVPGTVLAQLFNVEARAGASADTAVQPPSRLSVFASGTLGGGSEGQTAYEDGFNFKTRGLTTGADYRFSNALVAGAALGYANTDLSIDNHGGGLDARGWSVSLYGTYYMTNSFYLDGTLNYARNDYGLKRNIDYTIVGTPTQKTATGDTGGQLLALNVGGGYEIASKKGWTAELSARVTHLNSSIDSYSESGADELNLTLNKQTMSMLQSSLGGRLSVPMSYVWGVLIAQLNASWEHEFNNGANQIKGSFVNDRFNTSFAFKTDDPDRDYWQTAFGFSAVLPGGRTGFVQYQKTLARAHYSDYNLALGLRVELPY